jgi:hypothetical protein
MWCRFYLGLLLLGALALAALPVKSYPRAIYSIPTAEEYAPGSYALVGIQDLAYSNTTAPLTSDFLTEWGVIPHLNLGANLEQIGRTNGIDLDGKYQFVDPDTHRIGYAAGVFNVKLDNESTNPFLYGVATGRSGPFLLDAGVGYDDRLRLLLGTRVPAMKKTALLLDWTTGPGGLADLGGAYVFSKTIEIKLVDQLFMRPDFQRVQLAIIWNP